jgi:hypothetical protein
MNNEPKDNVEHETLSPAKKGWWILLLGFYFLIAFSLLLILVLSLGRHSFFNWLPMQIFISLVIIGSLYSVVCYSKLLSSPAAQNRRYQKFRKGISLSSFLGLIFLIILVPRLSAYKKPAYNSDAKANLHNMYLACKAYWSDSGSEQNCNADQYNTTTYGYIQSIDVSISGSGTKSTFTAKAHNTKGTKTFVIDYLGTISEVNK